MKNHVELFQTTNIYTVEYEGNYYSVQSTDWINGGYSENYVTDDNGEYVDPELASKIIEFVEENGGGELHEQL